MTAHIGPFCRSPLTDLSGGIMTHQYGNKCNAFEMRAVECLEAYGAAKGQEKCQDYLDDVKECMFQFKQVARVQAMRVERHRQWLTGERKSEDHYAPSARIDGF
ncbi:NADH dehydrogenase [ubiquinone] iron-sulfur protein 5 [Palaemon carinicauda]|uniref:NADH dehydrogenase [ubiquinone] iron-sulfur protein 5 n=1 Tax=Palaemon carinicauda TaxID=392227 RepID=UPI0035B57B88